MAKAKKLNWSDLHTIGHDESMVLEHLKKHWPVYLQIGLLTGSFVFASPDLALASSLDDSGNRIYSKIINIGKWVIIVKGGIEIIQSVTSGDLQSAKKSFLSYLLIYGALFALPWGMNEVETVFNDLKR